MEATIEANNPNLKSFIDIPRTSHFPIQNLPFGIFTSKTLSQPRVGVAIGDYVLDLQQLQQAGVLQDYQVQGQSVFAQSCLNPLMSLGRETNRAIRQQVSMILRHDNPALRDNSALREIALIPMADVDLLLPVEIGAYTDFYSSREHAQNVGKMFRPQQEPLLPNWLHLPVGYDGRVSNIVVSGTDFHRPQGQIKPKEDEPPVFSPSQRLDVEVEVAFILGKETALGETIPVEKADDYVFGVVLMNDWSARDIQKWEYVPLGPFLSKSFCTSISPWVVTLDALMPFKVDGPVQDPEPMVYLQPQAKRNIDIQLSLSLQTANMSKAQQIATTNYKYIYWDYAQQLAHHTINGCKMRIGDMYASGTVSGPSQAEAGSLLELSWAGRDPIPLDNNEQRVFLEDSDTAIISGYCQAQNYCVGFGEVVGTVLPAK